MTLLALTGTPGTGKTTVAEHLEERGWTSLHLGQVAEGADLLGDEDPDRPGTRLVDVEALAAHLAPQLDEAREDDVDLVVEAHWAHDLPRLDAVCVLRARPTVLEERLRERGWSAAKVRENAEAEAVGVIAHETRDHPLAFEVDTTEAPAEATADAVVTALRDPMERHPPGTLDWIAEDPDWFAP